MSVEFRCSNCYSLLRTPDASVGKKAKCPQCATILDVPRSAVPSSSPDEVRRPQPSANPYATPHMTPVSPFTPGLAISDLRHVNIKVDDILHTTWGIFTEQLGPLAVMGAIVFGVNALLQVFSQFGGMAAQFTGSGLFVFAFGLINFGLSFSVQTYLQLGATNFCVQLARSRQTQLRNLFEVWHVLLRGLVLSLLLLLVFTAGLVLFELPALVCMATQNWRLVIGIALTGLALYIPFAFFLFFRFLIAFPFIVDFQTSGLNALTLSNTYMRGNKLTAFLLTLIVMFVGGGFTCLTCFLGLMLYVPFWNLLIAVMYLSVSGQPFIQPMPKPQ